MTSTDFFADVKRRHQEAVERGEHDGQCEWREGGFFICNCSKRRRIAAGYTEPPGELIYEMPICPRCDKHVDHDGDSFTCPRCCVFWNADGTAEFYDDHGDLTADLAKWEAKHAKPTAPAVVDVQLPEPVGSES